MAGSYWTDTVQRPQGLCCRHPVRSARLAGQEVCGEEEESSALTTESCHDVETKKTVPEDPQHHDQIAEPLQGSSGQAAVSQTEGGQRVQGAAEGGGCEAGAGEERGGRPPGDVHHEGGGGQEEVPQTEGGRCHDPEVLERSLAQEGRDGAKE